VEPRRRRVGGDRDGAAPPGERRGAGTHPLFLRAPGAAPAHSPGVPLDPGLRAEAEARFGHDFGAVRLHTDAAAGEAARGINAAAFTLATRIYFAPGTYAPGTAAGRRLLGHELAHVVQQGRGGAHAPSPLPGSALERGARSAGEALAGGSGPVRVEGASAPGIARDVPSLFAGVPPETLSREELDREVALLRAWLRENGIVHVDRDRVQATLEHLESVLADRERRGASPGPRRPAPAPAPAGPDRAQFRGMVNADIEREVLAIRSLDRSVPVAEERGREMEAEMRTRDDEVRREAAAEREAEALRARAEQVLREMNETRVRGMLEVRARYPMLALAERNGTALNAVAELVIGLVPVVGQLAGLYEALSGRTLLNEDRISTGWRVFGGILAVLPMAGGIIRGGARAAEMVAAIALRARTSVNGVVRTLTGLDHLAAQEAALVRAMREAGAAEQRRAVATVLEALGEEERVLAREAHTAEVALNRQVMEGGVEISREAMIALLRRVRENPVVRRIFEVARPGRPAREVADEMMEEVLPAFEQRTGLTHEVVGPGHPHYHPRNVAIRGHGIFIAQDLLHDPDKLIEELAHDMFSYFVAGAEFEAPRRLPTVGGPFHAGSHLDMLLEAWRAGRVLSVEQVVL
jgi:hypothetical protein